MDSFTALSIAGTVIQFVQFSFGLLNSTQKIYSSATGSSSECEHLKNVHEKLQQFNNQIENWLARLALDHVSSTPQYITDLEHVTKRCKEDCQLLLDVLAKLRVKFGSKGRLWQSFFRATLEILRLDEIKQLEARIKDHQGLIVLNLCTISSQTIVESVNELRQLRREFRTMHSERIQHSESLSVSLNDVYAEILRIESKINDSGNGGLQRGLQAEEIATVTARVAKLLTAKNNFVLEESLLHSLDYEQRPRRHDAIATAHQGTFRWIFHATNVLEPEDVSTFGDWLEEEAGTFWISGKPGSGKSTLIKYVVNAEETRSRLASWATPEKKLVLAHHYFWSLGSFIQKSQEGLLRSLLLEILSRVPELIASVCEKQWEKLKNKTTIKLQWPLTDLEACLSKFQNLSNLPARFCFFVDGLDEFDGDPFELSRRLQSLSTCEDIKLCISSRPWNVFIDAFGQDPARTISMNELTRHDIQRYAESRMLEHPRWDSNTMADLIKEISMRASGVFLWVFLVTRMLREGLTNRDSPSDLLKRLNSIPQDLERFFQHILSSVESFYHEKMANILQISLTAEDPLPVYLYGLHELEYEDNDFVLRYPVRALGDQELQSLHDSTIWRLNAYCKGLLEIRDNNVEFLHRTVKDFLNTNEMSNFLKSKTSSNFSPWLSILKARIAWMKSRAYTELLPLEFHTLHDLAVDEDELHQSLESAKAVEEEAHRHPSHYSKYLDDLEDSLVVMRPCEQLDFEADEGVRRSFRVHVITHDLGTYIFNKLSDDSDYFADLGINPLKIALEVMESSRQWARSSNRLPRRRTVLEYLLKHGFTPNDDLDGVLRSNSGGTATTPWKALLENSLAVAERKNFLENLQEGVFSLLLRHGADPNIRISCSMIDLPGSYAPCWVIWLFSAFLIEEIWNYSDYYLQTFCMLLGSGADLNSLVNHNSMELWDSIVSPWIFLCHEIVPRAVDEKNGTLQNQRTWNDKVRFIAQVIITLAKFDTKRVLPWLEFTPLVESAFTNGEFRRLEKTLKIADKAQDTSINEKRGWEAEIDEAPGAKKMRQSDQ